MSQFDIYEYGKSSVQYLLDVQSDLLDGLTTRIVIPLVRPEATGPPARLLHPVIHVQGQPFVALVHLLAAVPSSSLRKLVASAKSQRDDIVRALDFLITG